MSDYIIQVRVKNGPMMRAMRKRGWTASDLARASNTQPTEVGNYLNLKQSPLDRNDYWRPGIMRIAEALNAMPEDLFPPQHIRDPLERNTGEIESMFSELAGPDLSAAVLSSPEDAMVEKDLRQSLSTLLESLTERQARIIRARFGIDGLPQTLDQVAKAEGVQRERIRQIEAKALREMRRRSKKFRELEMAD